MIYFDVTDVVQFATRYNRLTGIQRVQLNIVNLLARKHGAAAIRCTFFDPARRAMFEFKPDESGNIAEFNAEHFLSRIGMARPSSRFPSKVQVKSYLRRFNNNKLVRAFKKCDVYFSALFIPMRLRRLGLVEAEGLARTAQTVAVERVEELPVGSAYVCMGAMWLHPEAWGFAQYHRSRGGDVVQMIHDLIPVSCPQYFTDEESRAFDTWLKKALEYSSRFISVSNSTARDLRSFANSLGADPVVKAIPLAHEFMGYPRSARVAMPDQLAAYAGATYVLCVGTIEHRKNAVALLKVWLQLIRELGERTPLLVFAGKFGKGSAEFEKCLATHDELIEFVKIVHAPSDLDLAWLYGNALFTTLPSLIEGWGLPVGESAWFGKLCVASKTTSMPEVCGDLMDYVDPQDVESIKATLHRAITDSSHLAQRERGIAAAKFRSWADVADDIYRYVCARDGKGL